MRKTFKYRLYPSKAEARRLEETLEECRWVYNQTLELRKEAWDKEEESISFYESNTYIPIWKENRESLYGVHSQVLQNAQMRVDLAFKGFFNRCKLGETPGYPRFKGNGRYTSFTYPGTGFKIKDSRLFLSKIGDIKIILHRPIEGKIKTLTVRKTSTGKWFASFSCELPDTQRPVIETPKSVGIDLGLTEFATFSDGGSIPRKRVFDRYTSRLATASRKREKCEKGTPARKRARLIESKIHEKISNIRKDFAHKQAKLLVEKYDFICFEDLSIKSMQKADFKNIRMGVTDTAWGRFIQFTQYKAESAGKRVVLVNPRNTTKECSRCGLLVEKDLSERIHKCTCGCEMNRDLNAAINILRRGLTSLG